MPSPRGLSPVLGRTVCLTGRQGDGAGNRPSWFRLFFDRGCTHLPAACASTVNPRRSGQDFFLPVAGNPNLLFSYRSSDTFLFTGSGDRRAVLPAAAGLSLQKSPFIH